jgi:hypothetical protein
LGTGGALGGPAHPGENFGGKTSNLDIKPRYCKQYRHESERLRVDCLIAEG